MSNIYLSVLITTREEYLVKFQKFREMWPCRTQTANRNSSLEELERAYNSIIDKAKANDRTNQENIKNTSRSMSFIVTNKIIAYNTQVVFNFS